MHPLELQKIAKIRTWRSWPWVPGAQLTCPANPGRHADNLVLQILETR